MKKQPTAAMAMKANEPRTPSTMAIKSNAVPMREKTTNARGRLRALTSTSCSPQLLLEAGVRPRVVAERLGQPTPALVMNVTGTSPSGCRPKRPRSSMECSADESLAPSGNDDPWD